jgi:hypothetical protein
VHGLLAAYAEIRGIACDGAAPSTNTADSAVETHRVLEAIHCSATERREVTL